MLRKRLPDIGLNVNMVNVSQKKKSQNIPKIIYCGLQPQYFARLHYISRILNANVYVIRDEAQFVRKHKYPDGRVDKSFQAHTPIKTSQGILLLAVPTKHEGFLPIVDTKLANDGWEDDHLKTIRLSYNKSLNFNKLYPEIEKLIYQPYQNLADLNIRSTLWAISHLLDEEVSTDDLSIESVVDSIKRSKLFRLSRIARSSESMVLKDNPNLTANEKIIALCKEHGANIDFCGGTGVAAYVDHDIFQENGIEIRVQDWKCKEYPQQFIKQQGFIPNLSILDLLFNVPRTQAVDIIKG